MPNFSKFGGVIMYVIFNIIWRLLKLMLLVKTPVWFLRCKAVILRTYTICRWCMFGKYHQGPIYFKESSTELPKCLQKNVRWKWRLQTFSLPLNLLHIYILVMDWGNRYPKSVEKWVLKVKLRNAFQHFLPNYWHIWWFFKVHGVR